MSSMLDEIRTTLEGRAMDNDVSLVSPEDASDVYYTRADIYEARQEAFRESIEIVEQVHAKHTARCNAVLWHGPGHQSKTTCQARGPHEVHHAVYGSGYEPRQEAEWRGDEASTGHFDQPPQFGD